VNFVFFFLRDILNQLIYIIINSVFIMVGNPELCDG